MSRAHAHYLINVISYMFYVLVLVYLVNKTIKDSSLAIYNKYSLKYTDFICIIIISFVFSKKLTLIAILIYSLFYILDKKSNINYTWLLMIVSILCLLHHPMWSSDFFELHTATRLFAVLTAFFIFCMVKFINTDNLYYGLLSVIVSLYLIYGYEYHFGLFIVFSACMLLFYPNKTKKMQIILSLIILSALSYIATYTVFILPNIKDVYTHENNNDSLFTNIKNLFNWVKLYYFAIALFVYRLYMIFVKKERDNIYMDSLLITGIAGLVALVILGMFDPYCHMTNIVFCFLPILFYTNKLFYSKGSIVIFSMILVGLIGPYYKTTHDRIIVMNTTMPKVNEVVKLLNNGYSLSVVEPQCPDSIINGLTARQNCDMFCHRFSSIITFADNEHKKYNIKRIKYDDNINSNTLIIASEDWLDKYDQYKNRMFFNKKIDFSGVNILYEE